MSAIPIDICLLRIPPEDKEKVETITVTAMPLS